MRPTKITKISQEDIPHYSIPIYIDEFIGAAVKNASATLLYRISKAYSHGIHRIYYFLQSPGIQEGRTRYICM